ncbi:MULTISPECIES: ABC transporter permease [Rhizobium/Agrobacterium group]|uniref:ABC transporter permease n=1 Tax=Agrobacterium rosae TaxID=1972867 RepID=UPI00203443C1|nr:ABC transporter permease [Agrobacterium rosae]MCM2436081.1 ABC transporter permease [Agrobacterium rosae]
MDSQTKNYARRRSSYSSALLIAPASAVIFLFLLIPAALIALYSLYEFAGAGRIGATLTFENWRELLGDPYYIGALFKTCRIALTATIACAVVGYPVAYFMWQTKPAQRIALVTLLIVPFWISFIIRTFSWVYILGDRGLINYALVSLGVVSAPIKILYTETAVLIGLVHFLLPYMVMNILVGLDNVDKNVLLAARSLGASEADAFRKITLPLSKSGLWAGSMLTFVLAAGSYITPTILGGPDDFLFANLVSDAINSQLNWPMGSTLSVTMLIILGSVTLLFVRFMGIGRLHRALGG